MTDAPAPPADGGSPKFTFNDLWVVADIERAHAETSAKMVLLYDQDHPEGESAGARALSIAVDRRRAAAGFKAIQTLISRCADDATILARLRAIAQRDFENRAAMEMIASDDGGETLAPANEDNNGTEQL